MGAGRVGGAETLRGVRRGKKRRFRKRGTRESRRKTAGRVPRALKTLGRGYRRDADGMAACDVSVGGGKRRARRRRVARAALPHGGAPRYGRLELRRGERPAGGFPAVALCVAGHDHPGRYGRTLVPSAQLHSGYKTFGRVHYVTLEAMLEAPADGNAFAALEVYDHEVIVNAGGAARGFFGEKYPSPNVVSITGNPTGVSTGNADFSFTKQKKQTDDDDTNETRRSRNSGDPLGFVRRASSASSSARKNYATDRRLRISPRGGSRAWRAQRARPGIAGRGERDVRLDPRRGLEPAGRGPAGLDQRQRG